MADDAVVKPARIAAVLPPRETFGVRKSGAVALCVRDFQRYSRFAGDIDILGAGVCDYPDVRYRQLTGWRRWWRRDRDAYASAIVAAAADYGILEIHNRPYLIAAVRRDLPDTKLTLHLHNDPQTMDRSISPNERQLLLNSCDAIYCVSDFIRRRFLEGIADAAGKTLTILNGVALPVSVPAKDKVIAFTGRILPIKGVVELAQAFEAAALPGWRLAIAGDDPRGLLATIGGVGVDRLGQVPHDEAIALLARAEIAAVPSMWDDPCPRAAIEALAQGCALVASRRGGLPEIAGEAAVFVDPADTAAFAATLRRLASDEIFRKDAQIRGRAQAEKLEIGAATARLDAVRARLLARAANSG
jgi:UDP-glucose:(glucosyl)LPS alpha-1,2-glucosyltransferase